MEKDFYMVLKPLGKGSTVCALGYTGPFLTKNMFYVFYSFLAGLSLKLSKSAN